MIDASKKTRIVGLFIRERRESLKLSQRALGQLFDPPVTTQFVSNVERGVTPLPPNHIPTLSKALIVSEEEVRRLLEKEYSQKLSGQADTGFSVPLGEKNSKILVNPGDFEFIQKLYDAYRLADDQARKALVTVCESILNIRTSPEQPSNPQSDSDRNESIEEDSKPQTPLT